jgi:O-antigen/teichoic acid export membrane protein
LALMGNTGVSSLLGLLFWVVAARLYRPQLVGQDAALLAAMMLLSNISLLSLGQGIPRLLPQLTDQRRLAVGLAYTSTGLVATLFTVGFIAVAPTLSPELGFLRQNPPLEVLLVAATVSWNVFTLQDAVLTGIRWAVLVPVENAIYALLKIGLLFVFVGDGGTHGVLFAWLVALLPMLPVINWLLFARLLRSPAGQARQAPATAELLPISDRPRVLRFLAFDYVASLLATAGLRLPPLLVLTALGTESSAYFYVDFTIATSMYLLALAIGTSLVTEGAHDERALSSLARRALLGYGSLLSVACCLLALAAPIVLHPFGQAYVEHGTNLLRFLLAGCVPLTVVVIYLGVERVRGQAGRILAVQALSSIAVVAGIELLIHRAGLDGVGLAWLIGWSITGAVILPAAIQATRQPMSQLESTP